MFIWLIIIAVMVVSLMVLALLRKSKVHTIEQFADATTIPGSGNNTAPTMAGFLESISGGPTSGTSFKSASTTFVSGQENYLQNVLGKEVMTNEALPNYANVMNPVVNQPDVYLNTPEKIVVRNLQTDNNSKFTDADIQWCKSAKMPANLPKHVKGAAVGCGWYYIPDPKLSSSGALGQANGPIYPKGPNGDGVNGVPGYGNGQWIWDLTLAQQLEEIKNCARIKTCVSIDAPSVNGICGFCPSSGLAIPVNVDGTEKYPTSLTINKITAPAATCNTPTIMNSAECDRPAPKPFITPQGIDCGIYGYPSPDYSIRLYKQNDCVTNMGGNWVPTTSECLIQGGGSYSAVCSPLNGQKPAPPGPTVCTPDGNGNLSKACLISLAKSIGYTPSGSIMKMLQKSEEPGEIDRVAIQIVTGQNVPVNPILYKGGAILLSDAIVSYDNIFSLIKGGRSPIVQQAAMWLCIGTTGFDPCDLPESTPGPFFPQCVQQQWRIAGCQPAGTLYPSEDSTINKINTLTWGKVKEIFANTYNAMTSESDPVKQDIAVMRCLGITTKRVTPPPCVGISRDSLVINLDSAAFGTTDGKAAYTMDGIWKSVNAVYTGDAVASGTKVSDIKGVQFDGTTVLGTPNLVAQVLGIAQMKVLNGPNPSVVSSPMAPSKPPPILDTGFLTIGDVGMGVYSTEFHVIEPRFIINIDRAGWQPIFKQIHNDIAKGVIYNATVKGNNSGISYKFKVTECTDGSSWNGVFGNASEKKPDPILFIQDSALSFTIEKYVTPTFDVSQPILTAGGTLRDVGYPPGGIGIGGDQKTYFSIAFNYAINPVQSPDGTMPTLVNTVNDVIKGGKQSIMVTINVPSKGLSFSAPITDMGDGGWLYFISGKGPSPVAPDGGYYVKENGGRNLPQYAGWDGIANGGNPQANAELSLTIMSNVVETRELWINPNIDTCEILSIFGGTSYTETWTEMAIYKGQLVIGLKSNEKGYTFFNAGAIVPGQWSHIVHVYNQKDGSHEIYINGAGPVSINGLTRKNYGGYLGYSLGGGSTVNPLYQRFPAAMPFKGQIGAFRVYNRAFAITDVQNNLAATIGTYVGNQVELATKNDPNALAMAAGKFYVPMLGNSINYQASPQ